MSMFGKGERVKISIDLIITNKYNLGLLNEIFSPQYTLTIIYNYY
jgi:hypothetical protein